MMSCSALWLLLITVFFLFTGMIFVFTGTAPDNFNEAMWIAGWMLLGIGFIGTMVLGGFSLRLIILRRTEEEVKVGVFVRPPIENNPDLESMQL